MLPNTRVQRTRSSASPLRSPLTRNPLGPAGFWGVGRAALVPLFVTAVAHAQMMPMSGDSRLSMYGLGPVRIGMSVAQATAALRGSALVAAGEQESDACWYARIEGTSGIRLMIEDGAVSRVDIDDDSYSTVSGVRVGDTEQRARDVYGKSAEVLPDKYDPAGHNLVIRSRDRRFALVLETDGSEVTQIHAGKEPSAEYVEGCL